MMAKIRVLGILSTLWAATSSGELAVQDGRQTGLEVVDDIKVLDREARQAGEGLVDDRKVVCYYANWAVYRKGGAKFTPQNINPYLCTHLIYAFGGLGRDDSIVPFDEYQDIEKGGYGRFAALKTYNKDLKTLLAIGGWNEGSKRFSPLVADQDRRQVFIKSALRFLRQYNFDGVDLDWEYPTLRAGGRPQDKENYAILIAEMREAFESEARQTGKPRLLISMAVPASLEYAGQGYDIASLDRSLDWFNLLTYDYHSAQEPATNHHAPLYKPDEWSDFDFRAELNIDATIKFYLGRGASRDKLVLGIPTYGRSYTLANPSAHEVGSPTTGPGQMGEGTKEDGYLAYYEICERVLDQDWDISTPYPGLMGPYAHKGDQWVGFDDVDIAVEKAFYVAEERLGGIMFWTIDNDDFRGTCGKTPYPLIESAKEAMFSVETSVKTKTSVSVSTSEQTSVTRLRLTPQELADLATSSEKSSVRESPRRKLTRPPPSRREESPRSLSSSETTPEPPTTPSSGPEFRCKGEGFFAHPSNCKKYYWCLDTPNQGMVAHTFSCPQGLFFNQITDGCDFLRNVDCGDKSTKETITKKSAVVTEEPLGVTEEEDEDDVEDPKSLKDILEIVKAAGGVEGLEKQIEEEEQSKKEEEDRRVRISSRTRNRLNQLLKGGQQKKPQRAEETSPSPQTRAPPTLPRRPGTTSKPPASIRTSLLSRLANRRRTTLSSPTQRTPGDKIESGQKIKIVGAHLDPEEPEEQALHLGIFKPKAGVREKLRKTLHTVLEHEMIERAQEKEMEDLEQSTTAPDSTVTISKNTRLEEAKQRGEEVKVAVGRQRLGVNRERIANKDKGDKRYTTIQRGRRPQPLNSGDIPSKQVEKGPDGSDVFRPTVPDIALPTDPPATRRPFFPTKPEEEATNQQDTTFADLQTNPPTTQPPTRPSTKLPTRAPIRLTSRPATRAPPRPPTRILPEVPRRGNQSPRKLDSVFNIRNIISKTNRQSAALLGQTEKDLNPATPVRRPDLSPATPVREPDFSSASPIRRPEPSSSSSIRRPDPFSSSPIRRPDPSSAFPIRRPDLSQVRRQEQAQPITSQPARSNIVQPVREDRIVPEQTDYEYEYYYEYLDDNKPNSDYDLVPLAKKVRLLSDGSAQCLDVGVFAHPTSCKKFVNCFRNPGTGIQGSIYQCPSYLAFDPVGGRCNWVNEIVCAA